MSWPWTTGDLVSAADLNTVGAVKLDAIALDSVTSFSSIDQTWRDLYISIVARSTTASATVGMSLRVNGNSTNAYHWQALQVTDTSVTASVGNGVAQARIGNITGDSATAAYFGSVGVWIPNYASTSMRVVGRSESSAIPTGSATTNWSRESSGWLFNSSGAVSSLSFQASAGFASGSVATLYGVGQL